MKLLTLSDYIALPPGESFTPTPAAIEGLLQYLTSVWEDLHLDERPLRSSDLVAVFQHGALAAFHVKVYPRKLPDTRVIVFADAIFRSIKGHLLIDLAAQDLPPILTCPPYNFEGFATPELIEQMIGGLDPDDDNPFAIVETSSGTYMQTLCTPDGFVLEFQLVNTSSHYEAPELVSLPEVVRAMRSYASGDQEWLQQIAWQQQHL